ncbi:MAG: carbohydrate porin [Candidatus Omnitrophica bacterium]|nr:carbohydrate porin [Candidatus Omnitrophota bacterium]MDD5351977.1 carbohydrate porin [Candidatus Omnitrophota bacterium]MDD5550803.1 carbohydrate porin [Candidatus Omnitrophota bacterium]
MVRLRKASLFLAVLFFCAGNICWADDVSFRKELDQLKARVQALENKLAEQDKCMNEQKKCILDQEKKISAYESRLAQFDTDLHRQVGMPIGIAEGLEIGAGATMIMQGANNTNNATAGVSKNEGRTDASYSADITIGKEFEDAGGRAFLHLEVGQGSGLEDDLTLYSNVNRDADNDNNVRLTELWYEQAFLKDKAAATFGKLDPTAYFDNNEVANDETTQFLGRIFRNSPTIEFPDNTAGMRFTYLPAEWLELGYGVFDADSDWEKVGDNLFNIGQVTFKTNFFDLSGNYRLLAWQNNSYHTKWLANEQEKESAFGFGLSLDQKVNDIVTVFSRYGWQNPKVYNPNITATGDDENDPKYYSLEHSWSAGLQVEGKPWGREKDILGFAIGQILSSKDYKKSDDTLRAKTEGHLETYYRIYINDHFSISPDLQYIWNPFGKDVAEDTDPIFVGGVRAQIDF